MQSSHAARGRNETSACMCGWAQLLEDEDLPSALPFFLGATAVAKLQTHSLESSVSWSPENTQKLYIRSDGR